MKGSSQGFDRFSFFLKCTTLACNFRKYLGALLQHGVRSSEVAHHTIHNAFNYYCSSKPPLGETGLEPHGTSGSRLLGTLGSMPSAKAVHLLSSWIDKVAMSRAQAVGTKSARTRAPQVLKGR